MNPLVTGVGLEPTLVIFTLYSRFCEATNPHDVYFILRCVYQFRHPVELPACLPVIKAKGKRD